MFSANCVRIAISAACILAGCRRTSALTSQPSESESESESEPESPAEAEPEGSRGESCEDAASAPQRVEIEREQGESMVAFGERLYVRLGCSACHGVGGEQPAVGPPLRGLWGSQVERGGAPFVVEGAEGENYLKESLLIPTAKRAAGLSETANMPSFAGMIHDLHINALTEYIKVLRSRP